MKTQRQFMLDADRHTLDAAACSSSNGFAQFDTSQDVAYYGIWGNPWTLTVVTYCEGDVDTDVYDNAEEFVEGIRVIMCWHTDHGHEFTGIDGGSNAPMIARFKSLGLGDLLH